MWRVDLVQGQFENLKLLGCNKLDPAVVERAEISALVSTRSLKIRDLDETVEKVEVVSALWLEG